MKTGVIILLLLVGLMNLTAQVVPGNDMPLKLGPNYRIYPSQVNQTEVFIARSPLDQNILFSACNTLNFIPFFISEGIFATTDAGITWKGSDTCSGDPIGYHGGDPGITIDKNGTFILTRLGRSPFVGLYSHFSNDNGQTWSSQKVISTDDLERAALTTDANKTSPWYGRSYAAWVKFALPFPLLVSLTDDGGQQWSVPKQINNPPNRSAGGDIVVGPAGEVYVCWAGVTETSPFKETHVGFASSRSGGTSWNVVENAFPMDGITGILPEKDNIRVNGLPSIAVDTTNGPRKGWIYIVTGQRNLAPAGSDPDIILNRSTDGGASWSGGIRVNQDPLNNGKIQYFPAIHIDKYGAVNVIFYDDRNTTSDSAGVFLSRSEDGGNSWREFEISDHNYKPKPIGGLGQGYQGDNIDLTSTDTKLWPVWMDNSSGIYQIWTVPIDFSSIIGIDDHPGMLSPSLKINSYPNPFNTSATIGFKVNAEGMISLKIYDLLGGEIAELVREHKSPGYYEVIFSPEEHTSSQSTTGTIFLYKLTMDEHTVTGKLVFVR